MPVLEPVRVGAEEVRDYILAEVDIAKEIGGAPGELAREHAMGVLEFAVALHVLTGEEADELVLKLWRGYQMPHFTGRTPSQWVRKALQPWFLRDDPAPGA